MKSIPVAVKVGSAGVLGGGGIAGTGLLINNQIQKSKTITSDVSLPSEQSATPEEDLDAALKDEAGVSLKVDPENATEFTVEGKNATLKIKAVSTEGGKFTGDKWVCIIKGTVAGIDNGPSALDTSNFDKGNQVSEIKSKLTSGTDKFIESCKKWREDNQKTTNGWTSEIVVKLAKGNEENAKYKFSEDSITKMFDGTLEKSTS